MGWASLKPPTARNVRKVRITKVAAVVAMRLGIRHARTGAICQAAAGLPAGTCLYTLRHSFRETAMPPMSVNVSSSREWLETDGLGGFASGSVAGIRTRRYHALLLTATTPPTGRFVLVNGFDAWLETSGGRFDLSSQWYSPGVMGGNGAREYREFRARPMANVGIQIRRRYATYSRRFSSLHGAPVTCVAWKLLSSRRRSEAHRAAVSLGPRLPRAASEQPRIPF